ncbi:MAG TPA: riboflavin synthase [Acidobacteriaceae bacterium]|jgi:riboflavin synthase|nr:riboflavin synthase [Acidobacteriaceae bacterium]
MFTGLIETTGKILALQPSGGTTRIAVSGPASLVQRLKTGDSVAVSGVCLTALDIDQNAGHFHADLAAETIARTSLSRLKADSVVNLELPTPAGTPLGGHIVQGHVDGVGELLALKPVTADAERTSTDWWLQFSIPENCARYVVEKGSITVEGISLTVAKLEDRTVTIAIIPHTYAATNLHTLTPGSPLNIEVDVLAKYAERLTASAAPEFELTLEYLISNGY